MSGPVIATSDLRTRAFRIGGWAALLAAIAIPAKLVATVAQASAITAGDLPKMALLVEAMELLAVLVVAWTLRSWMSGINRQLALGMLAASLVGPLVGALANGVLIAGAPMSDELLLATGLVSQVGLGLWFLIGGTLIGRDDRQTPRLGWIGQVGGLGFLLTAGTLLLPPDMAERLAAGNLIWFLALAGIFALVYLVRLGRFMAFGHISMGRI